MSVELATALEGLLICTAIGFMTLKAKILNQSGLMAAVIVGWPIYVFGGWQWFTLLLVFYSVSAIFSKYKYDVKSRIEVVQEKNGIRSWRNVLANGGVAMTFALLQVFFTSGVFFAGFIGSVSTALADTLATEIGLMSPKAPRLITSLKKRIPAGTSGGVTSRGFLASFSGTLIIWLSSVILGFWPSSSLQMISLVMIFVSGIAGCVFDSVLGATIQGTYKCPACGRVSEKEYHCGKRGSLIKGSRAVNNNAVNLSATIFGAIIAILLYALHV